MNAPSNISDHPHIKIRQTVRDVIVREFPDYERLRFVLGVSGGLDSMCLFHILLDCGVKLEVVHINYQKRGTESDSDAALVRQTAEKNDQNYHEFLYPAVQNESGNFQELARKFRRTCFEDVMFRTKSVAIFIAHHRDDQTETILQRLFRGAGLSSINGMDMISPPYVRPMLEITRKQIEFYAKSVDLKWRVDASNAIDLYARNWIRNTFAPDLDRLFPGWENNLHIHARRLNATVELADRWLDAYGVHGTCFPLKLIDFVSDDLTALILHHWLTNNRVFPSTGQIDQVMRLRDANPGARIIMNDKVTVLRDRDELKVIPTIETRDVSFDVIQITESDLETESADFLLDAGSIEIHVRYQDVVNFRTHAGTHEPDNLVPKTIRNTNSHPDSPPKSQFTADELTMDADTIEFPISIRPWQEGDRIQPYGLEGTKLISDILTDKKIASSKKRSAYVITDFDEKICAVIFPHPTTNRSTGTIDHDCRITDDTTSKLNIKIRYHS